MPTGRPPRVDGAAWRMSYVGHASLLLQTAGLNILIDPVWSERASPFRFVGPKRVNDPGIAFDAICRRSTSCWCRTATTTISTSRRLSRLAAAHRPRVITPLGNDAIMRDHDPAIAAEAYDWHERVELGTDIAVTLVPTRHWSARSLSDRNKALWASFVIETPAGRIYFVARFRLRRRRAFPRGARALRPVPARASCRSAPTSRAGSCAIST